MPKYYAHILLAVDASAAPDYPYLALRITPDQLALIEYNGTTVNELDVIAAECEQNTWYTVNAAFEDDVATVTCTSEVAGTPMATLSGTSEMLNTLDNETNTIGFTVGELADYHFRSLEYVTVPNTTINDVTWDYDPYGRKIARTEYDGTGTITAQTRYVYDGWQLVQEIDVLNGNTVLAEYVYGPGYIDDVIQSSHGGNTYYHHTDQQYSTVAVTDGSGTVVERYGYDAFGNATFYKGDGTPLTTGSAINNPVLYTGRTWQPELGLYDYRNRQYDPAIGRFTTPDPLGAHGDWNNLGNAYTYVGNNPGSYLDPLGLEGIDYDLISKPIPGSNARAYIRMLSNREDPLVRSVKNIAEAYIAFGGGITPLTDFTDSYDPNLPINAFAHLVGEELNPVNFIIGGTLGHVAGAMFRKGKFITNRVFRNTEGLWVDELGEPLTGVLKHEGNTINLLEGLADDNVKEVLKKGTGPYVRVRGHHIHAKSAFKGVTTYDPMKGFSISREAMESLGLSHRKITAAQRRLFKELNESGSSNTLEAHSLIARQSLIAGGASEQLATDLVASSLDNLVEQGVSAPTNLPWYK